MVLDGSLSGEEEVDTKVLDHMEGMVGTVKFAISSYHGYRLKPLCSNGWHRSILCRSSISLRRHRKQLQSQQQVRQVHQ
jgi:hypothetical protein